MQPPVIQDLKRIDTSASSEFVSEAGAFFLSRVGCRVDASGPCGNANSPNGSPRRLHVTQQSHSEIRHLTYISGTSTSRVRRANPVYAWSL
jgi:hypothetical protein